MSVDLSGPQNQPLCLVCHTLLKIKVLHDAIEEPFCLNDSIKNF